MEPMEIVDLNLDFPDNIAIIVQPLKTFALYLYKLSDMWEYVVTPDLEPDEEVHWTIAYTKYTDDTMIDKFIFWVFLSGKVKVDIKEEIESILEEDKENATQEKRGCREGSKECWDRFVSNN